MNVLKSMEIRSGHLELSIISQVSTVEGCPLSRVPLYYKNEAFIKNGSTLDYVE